MPDEVREFIASQIAVYEPIVVHAPDRRGRMRQQKRYRQTRAGRSPIEMLAWARDCDKAVEFQYAYAAYVACSDPKMREAAWHPLVHAAIGVTECIGWAGVEATGKSLGFSEHHIKYLVDQFDQEAAAVGGLTGSE